MPNIKISALPEVTTVSGSDITAVVATGVTSKISISNLANSLPTVSSSISSSYPFALSGSTIYTTAFGSTTLFSTQESTFIGQQAGASSSYAGNNNRWITAVGYQAASASDDAESSVSVGHLAGSKSYIYETVSIGKDAGYTSSFLQGGVNIGARAGSESNMGYTVAIGNGAGQRVRINPSLFGVYYSVFIGHNAGYSTTQPGYSTTFIGRGTGQFSSHVTDTVAIGTFAAQSAVSSSENNFIGVSSGETSRNVQESNFFGTYSGYNAISASFSNAIGYYAGYQISGSNHSILIGSGVGRRISGTGIGENNIIIGKNITLENGRRNSMNLGGIIFATGSYAADSVNYFVNPAFSGSAGGRVGINVINPTYTLDVSGSGNYTNGLTVTGSLATLGDITASNALFTGTVTAQRLVVQIITSSVSFITGSTKFGSLLTDTHQFTGSVSITGSLSLTGAVASMTSSWALNVPASGVSGLNLNSISTGSVTASVNINTASFQITSASSQLLFVSNSGLITGRRLFLSSSQNMATGSTLVVFGSGSAQPVFTVQGSQGELFSVNDSLSGSLFSVNDISGLPIIEAFSDNRVFIGSYQAPMLTTTVRTTLAVGSNIIYQNIPTASYDAVLFEYSLKSGSNARAGSIMGIWSGSDANYNEVVTTDFGDTTGVKFMVMVTGSNVALTGSATTANWTMKTIIRSI